MVHLSELTVSAPPQALEQDDCSQVQGQGQPDSMAAILRIASICPIVRSLVPVSVRQRGLAGHSGPGGRQENWVL